MTAAPMRAAAFSTCRGAARSYCVLITGSRVSPVGEERLNAMVRTQDGFELAELDLSVRATNCLESENITTVRDLVTRSEGQLLEVRNFGETTLHEVREKLADIGLRLGMRLPSVTAGSL